MWEVWRKAEIKGGNLIMRDPAFPDVSSKTEGGEKIEEFDTHQEAEVFIGIECFRFLRCFKLRNKRRSKGLVFISRTASYSWIEGHSYDFRKGVRLFNAGRNWWLRYGPKRHTGRFESRNKALLWYLRDGR